MVRRAAKSGTGLQFNKDVLFTEDLQKNCTPVPDFTKRSSNDSGTGRSGSATGSGNPKVL